MFSEAKALFFQSLRGQGISPRTERNYREAIDQFTAFFLADDLWGELDAVKAEDIEAFLGQLLLADAEGDEPGLEIVAGLSSVLHVHTCESQWF